MVDVISKEKVKYLFSKKFGKVLRFAYVNILTYLCNYIFELKRYETKKREGDRDNR